MSKLELRPTFLLGILAALGLLINLVIVATGAGAQGDEDLETIVNPRRQQIILERLNEELAAVSEEQFPTLPEVQQKLGPPFFSLATTHDVTIASLDNDPPLSETLGRTDYAVLVSRVELRGLQSNIINMLLKSREIFGNTSLISDLAVAGTSDKWVIKYALTQYLKSS